MDRSFEIRDARPDERGIVRELTIRAYAEYASIMEPVAWAALERALHGALGADGRVERIVADKHGTLIGSVLLYPPHSDAYGAVADQSSAPELRLLSVPPEERGRGVARALVDECIRRARERGACALGLHTSRSMRSAIHLYERMGFVRAPETDFRAAGSELVEGYRLPLTTA